MNFSKLLSFLLSHTVIQLAVISLLILVAFFKVLDYPFNANREIGWIIQLTGREYNFTTLMRSHGFISYFNYLIFKNNPFGWYLTGIIFHILASWMAVIFSSSLLKSKVKGFIVGLLFAVSTVGHDAITIGSAYSMYAAQLFLFLLTLYLYKLFREKKKKLYYLFAVIVFSLIIPVRDSGVFFLPILIAFDIICYGNWMFSSTPVINRIFFFTVKRKFQVKKVFTFLLPLVPFILITLFFMYVRHQYGGSPYDYNDHRARLTLKLIEDHEYVTYIRYTALGFFFFLSSHLIPYPLLNLFKNILTTTLQQKLINIYFLPLLGFAYYAFFTFVLLKQKKSHFYNALLFAFTFLTIATLFYSIAITLTEGEFSQNFGYDEHRWRYTAFFGTCLFIVIFASDVLKRFKKTTTKKIIFVSIALYLIINTLLLISIQVTKYNESLKHQKLFYATMLSHFPTYDGKNVLYFFPISFQLRDYLEEWHNLWIDYYQGIQPSQQNWAYEEMKKVLVLLKSGDLKLSQLYFIDFDLEKGVINSTDKLRREILNQKEAVLISSPTLISSPQSFTVKNISPVEFPYKALITMRAVPTSAKSHVGIDVKKFDPLVQYSKSRQEILSNMQIEVCNTSGKRDMYNPNHLIDGNLGTRSVWLADCGPDWFILNLKKVFKISGFMMRGLENDTLSPASYKYEVSIDGKNWEMVMEVKDNTKWELLDKWPKIYDAQYIRVTVLTTQRGGFVQLDEAEPVDARAEAIFQHYKDWKSLQEDEYALISKATQDQMNYMVRQGLGHAYATFEWSTNLTGVPEDVTSYQFPFVFDGASRTYEIPIYESEAYSWPGQFLMRYIEKATLDTASFPGDIYVEKLMLVPEIKIVNSNNPQDEN